MTEPLKWALVDLLRLLNAEPGAAHEKLEGIAATLGVDIHASRSSGEWPTGISIPDDAVVTGLGVDGQPVNWRKQKRATRG